MKILIAVHHQIVRDGITRILADDPDITVSATAENREQLCSFVSQNDIDVVVMDLDMPDLDVMNTLAEVRENHPDTRVLAISDNEDIGRIKSVLQAGASGFMLKKRGANELLQAAKVVNKGNPYLCDESIKLLVSDENSSTPPKTSADLTDRELEVLGLICEEYINREIADKLGISVRTVDAHRRNLLQKTAAKNTAGLVKFAIRHRLFTLS